jgi:hypothetical protein
MALCMTRGRPQRLSARTSGDKVGTDLLSQRFRVDVLTCLADQYSISGFGQQLQAEPAFFFSAAATSPEIVVVGDSTSGSILISRMLGPFDASALSSAG